MEKVLDNEIVEYDKLSISFPVTLPGMDADGFNNSDNLFNSSLVIWIEVSTDFSAGICVKTGKNKKCIK